MHKAIIIISIAFAFSVTTVSLIMFGSNTFLGVPLLLLAATYMTVIVATVLYDTLYAEQQNVALRFRIKQLPINIIVMFIAVALTFLAASAALQIFAPAIPQPTPKFIFVIFAAALIASFSIVILQSAISHQTDPQAGLSDEPNSATQGSAPTE